MADASVVVLTFSRVHLLRQCVENVLLRTSRRVQEIVIWNNASTDDTAAYLATITDPRFRIVNHPENIGMNAYREAVALTTGAYIIELDDDVIDAPPHWDRVLIEAYDKVPGIGYLGANLVDNPHDVAARIMYGANEPLYQYCCVNGVRLKLGPVGGPCNVTGRDIYELAGGFPQNPNGIFWQEDAAYIEALERRGLYPAMIDDLQVLHAGGEYYAPLADSKKEYWSQYFRQKRRRDRVKALLLKVPGVRGANARFRWFVTPEEHPVTGDEGG